MDAFIATNLQGTMIAFEASKLGVSKGVLEKQRPLPKVLLELGTYGGYSAVGWGAMLKELNGGRSEGVMVYSCEVNEEFVRIANDIVKLAGLDDVVEILCGKSPDLIRKLSEEGLVEKRGLDVLFIDHWEHYYLPDFKLVEDLELFREGSVVIADNTDKESEYTDYVRSGGRGGNGGYKIKTESIEADIPDVPARPLPGKQSMIEVTTMLSESQ